MSLAILTSSVITLPSAPQAEAAPPAVVPNSLAAVQAPLPIDQIRIVFDGTAFTPEVARLEPGTPLLFVNNGSGVLAIEEQSGQFTLSPIPSGGGAAITLDGVGSFTYSDVDTGATGYLVFGVSSFFGAPGTDRVVDHIPNVWAPIEPESAFSIDPVDAIAYSRSRLKVAFVAGATVAEAEGALQRSGTMLIAGNPTAELMTVAVPATADHSAVRAAQAQLQSEPAVDTVVRVGLSVIDTLPAPIDLPGGTAWEDTTLLGVGPNSGQQAAGFPQLWNFTETLERRISSRETTGRPGVTVSVWDGGFDPTHPDLSGLAFTSVCVPTMHGLLGQDLFTADVCTPQTSNLSAYLRDHDNNHGNNVSGIIGGRPSTDPAWARQGYTGGNPTATMVGIEQKSVSWDDELAQVLDLKAQGDPRFADLRIVSLSMADLSFDANTWARENPVFECGPGPNDDVGASGPCLPWTRDGQFTRVQNAGSQMIPVLERAEAAGVVVVVSAGNSANHFFNCDGVLWSSLKGYPTCPRNPSVISAANNGIPDARFNSSFTAANAIWTSVSTKPNPVIVVESLSRSHQTPTKERSAFSMVQGTWSAQGYHMGPRWTFDDGLGLWGPMAGTSQATPTVTAVLSSMLTLHPNMSVQELRNAVRTFADTTDPTWSLAVSPRIDPLGSMLQVQGGLLALLDVSDPSLDGNRRVVLSSDGSIGRYDTTSSTEGGFNTEPDGVVDIRDFRRFRDAWLQVCDISLPDISLPECSGLFGSSGIGIDLDGYADHPKKDLNFDGCVATDPPSSSCPTPESVFPRLDFNGDGRISSVAQHTVNLDSPAVSMTDLDVLAREFQEAPAGTGWSVTTAAQVGTAANAWTTVATDVPSMLKNLLISGDITVDVRGLQSAGATNMTVQLREGLNDVFTRPIAPDEPTVIVTAPAGRSVELTIAGTRNGVPFEYAKSFTLEAGEDVPFAPCGVIRLSSDSPGVAFGGTTGLTAELVPCDEGVDKSGQNVAFSVSRVDGGGDATVDTPRRTLLTGVAQSTFHAGLVPGEYIVTANSTLPSSDGTSVAVDAQLLIEVAEGYLVRTLDVRDAGLLGQNPSLNDAGTVVYTSSSQVDGPRNELNRWDGDAPVEIGANVRANTAPDVNLGDRVEITNDGYALVSGFDVEFNADGSAIASSFREWALQVYAGQTNSVTTLMTSSLSSTIHVGEIPTGNGIGGRVLPVQRDSEIGSRVAQYTYGQLALGPELGADWIRHADNGYTVGRADLWPVELADGTVYTSAIVVGDANLGNGAGTDQAFVTPMAIQDPDGISLTGWLSIGDRPDISASGDVIAFIGDSGDGPSVYVAVRANDQGSYYAPVAITGPGRVGPPELGTLGTDPVHLVIDPAANEHHLNVGVVHAPAGVAGLAEDIVTVAVFGRPSVAGVSEGGLFTIALRLGGSGEVTAGLAEPVVLLGDTDLGDTAPEPVSAIGWHRVIAEGGTTGDPGDHQLAFWVRTGTTERIVHAQWVGAPSLSAAAGGSPIVVATPVSSGILSGTPSRTASIPVSLAGLAAASAMQVSPPPPPEIPAVIVSDLSPEVGDLITITNRSPLRSQYGGWLTFAFDGVTQSLSRGETKTIQVDAAQALLTFAAGSGIEAQIPLDVQIPAGAAPVAVPGGPYEIDSGADLVVDGSLSSDSDGTIVTYDWELDGDGLFDDATSPTTVIPWYQVANAICGGACTASTTGNIELRVTDDDGLTSTATAQVSINVVIQDFNLAIYPNDQLINENSSTDLRIDVGSVGGFIGDVDLEIISSIPADYTVRLSATRVTAPGSTSIVVTAPPGAGDDPITFPIEVRGTSGTIVHETSATTTVVIGLIPICYETVTGIVLDRDSREPLPNVDVTLTYVGTATTDIGGRYSFPLVAEGSQLRLRANPDGYFVKDVFEYSTCGGPNEIDIEVVARRSVIIRGGIVEGIPDPTDTSTTRVVSPTATPVPGATVIVSKGTTVNAGADGAYSTEVFLDPPDNRTVVSSVRAIAPGFWDGAVIGITVEDGPAIDVDVPLVRACTAMVGARGRVVDQNGTPLPGRSIRLDGSNGPRPGYSSPLPWRIGDVVTSDADGYYDIPAGQTYFNTNNARWPFRVVDETTRQSTAFEYGNCDTTHVQDIDLVVNIYTPPVIVRNYGEITGRVIDAETGEPVPYARVSGVSTGLDGTFTVRNIFVGTNQYTVLTNLNTLISPPNGYYGTTFGPYNVVADETTDVGDLELIPVHYYSLEGYILDQVSGAPVEGASVSLSSLQNSPRLPLITDADGFYSWDKIIPDGVNEPATATVTAVKTPAYPWSPPETYFRETASVDLVPGQLANQDMELLRRCDNVTVRGHVVDAVTGEPIENASIQIGWHSDGTDADGFFLFEGLGAGSYNTPGSLTLVASKSGYYTLRKTITVFCGATITVNFGAVTGSGAVFGTVKDDTGAPIEDAFIGSGSGDSATTAADGTYRMDDVPLGLDNLPTTWEFTAIHPDGRELTASAEVTDGEETELKFVFPVVAGPVNTSPTADDLFPTVVAGESVGITLSGGDDDGDPLTFVVKSQPASGSLSGTAPDLTFAAPPTAGEVSFQYVSNDGTEDSALATVTITVTPKPTLSDVAITDVFEMGTSTLSGVVAGVGVDGSFALSVDWGDGSAVETFTYGAGTTTFTETHRYVDDNPTGTAADNYRVDLTLTDPTTGSATADATVTVTNLTPTVLAVAITDVNENDIATLSGGISDIGTEDSFTLTVDWGDGSAAEVFSYPAGTTSFSETHRYLDDDPTETAADNYTVELTLTDDDTGSSTTSTTVKVTNLAPVVSSDTPSQTVQYSDVIAGVTISADDVASDVLEAEASWKVDGGVFVAGLPDGLSLNANPCGPPTATNMQTCTWTLSGTAGMPSGTYLVRVAISDDDLGEGRADTTVVVEAEDATVAFDTDNDVVVEVDAPGSDSSVPFTLRVSVRESMPDDAAYEAAPGDINRAEVSMTFEPVGPGPATTVQCVSTETVPTNDYSALLTVACDFTGIGVNTYATVANVTGGYYAGSSESVLVVFDPSLGFTTGGGTYTGANGDRVNFGYTMKYNKKRTKIQGSLLVIRHAEDGLYRLKSNQVVGLALGWADGFGWASFSGKATYKEPTWEDAVGNYEFIAYVEDHDTSGIGADRFWVTASRDGELAAGLSIDPSAVDNAVELDGGNIVVPHQGGGGGGSAAR